MFKIKCDVYIKCFNGIYECNFVNDKVEYIYGWVKFLLKNLVEVILDDGSKEVVNVKKILIVVGGNLYVFLEIFGFEFGINSDGFFDIDKFFKKVVFVGVGYIVVEFVGMFNVFGVEIYLFICYDIFFCSFDLMIQEKVMVEYERFGIYVYKRSLINKVEKDEKIGKFRFYYNFFKGEGFNGEGVLEDVDYLIWVIGCILVIDGFGFEVVGVKIIEKGYIVVDEY